MYLYFENSQGKRRLLSQLKTEKDCFKEISKFLKEHNFVSYYMKTWKPYEYVTQVDVGSHTEFFYISIPPCNFAATKQTKIWFALFTF